MTGKERLIELLKLLYVQTDEDHPLSTAQIVSYFKEQNVTTDRETVKVDVAALNNCGIEIYATKGTQTKYYFSDRRFELAELKLLVDAVESSKFITAKKSGELVKKLMRDINCPFCGYLVERVFSDISGHKMIFCKKCKEEYPVNLGYFRRMRVLTNEIYIGTLSQHKRGTPNHKVKKEVDYDREDWIVVTENHVYPIVGRRQRFEVQDREREHRQSESTSPSVCGFPQ